MLQYEELRLRLENLWPDIEDLANAIGLDQLRNGKRPSWNERSRCRRLLGQHGDQPRQTTQRDSLPQGFHR